ncbi:MAG TPA: hypothetical protein ENK38_03190 [Gammaproteobacteria bacterium]|nr:hypothetical protein [Gammaproteobacteria bacterium]
MISIAVFFLLAISLIMPDAYAGEWRYSIEDEIGYSTNIARTADNEIDEYTNAARIGVRYEENSVDLEGSIGANIEHLSYLSGVFENEIRSYLNADLKWSLMENRLFWMVEDTLSIEPVLSRQAWMPGNVQQTNVFSTGPSIIYRLDSSTRVTADVRYMNSYAEETREFNSNRWYLGTSLIQESSLLTDVSANLTWTNVDFNDEDADDYQQVGLFAAWDQQYGRSGLRFELGGLGINFDRGDDKYGPYTRLVWNRLISSASRLLVAFNYGFADAAQQVSGRTRAAPVSSNIISSQVYTNSEVEVAYRTEWARSVLETSLNYQKQLFLNSSDLDQSLVNIRIAWSKGFRGGISTDSGISYARTVYDLDDRTDDTLSPFFGIYFQRSSRLSYSIRSEWESRDSSVNSSDYSDLMFYAAVSYRH